MDEPTASETIAPHTSDAAVDTRVATYLTYLV